ncbi:MAG: metal ABC transporter ATP-binding protein [Clostridiales bacterium]
MNIIEIKELYVNYNNTKVLENINLNVKENQFLGIIGPNGGGKTTLIKSILGLVKPVKGNIYINENIDIGYVPQFSNFERNFPINVMDVILMGRLSEKFSFFKSYRKEDVKLAKEVMLKLGIYDFRNRQIGKLSGGQMQKVLIARSIINNPKILILDEPTSNIDSNTRIEIFNILKQLNNKMTILIVSHDVDDIVLYVDSIVCLNKNLHYHENNKKIDSEEFQRRYNCPVKYYLEEDCKSVDCSCGGFLNDRKYI